MKKILFGSTAAICTVVGLSSFKHPNTTNATYYIFQTTDALVHAVIPGQPPAQNVSFNNAMLSSFLGIDVVATDASGVIARDVCFGGPDWCAVGFLHSQVDTLVSPFELTTNAVFTKQPNEKFATETDN